MTQEQESQGSEQLVPGDLVSESLLSWAKDVRYVTEIQEALHDAFEPNMSYTGIETPTWFMAYFLYIFTVMRQKGRSLGMEATGLQFAPTRNRPILALAALGCGSWALHGFWNERNPTTTSEELRGTDRQRRHELLRQQMLERSAANSQISLPQPSRRSGVASRNRVLSANTYQDRVVSVIKDGFQAFFRSFIQTVRYGPHTAVSSSEGSRPPPISMLTWIFRLYTAHYLISGKHPTIVHGLLGLQHKLQVKSRGLSVEPGGHRMVALLIALQGSATLVRFVLKVVTNRVACYLEEKKSSSKRCGSTSFEITPEESFSVSLCAICRTARVQPAASRTCGHVFCWPCLSHWVSSVKDACPYCRSPCRMEDIQPLYNYDQPLKLVSEKKESTLLRSNMEL